MNLHNYISKYGICSLSPDIIAELEKIIGNGLHKNLKKKIIWVFKYKLQSLDCNEFWDNFHIKTKNGMEYVEYIPTDEGKRSREIKGIRESFYQHYDSNVK